MLCSHRQREDVKIMLNMGTRKAVTKIIVQINLIKPKHSVCGKCQEAYDIHTIIRMQS